MVREGLLSWPARWLRREHPQQQSSRAEYGDEGTEAMTSMAAFRAMLFTGKVLDLALPTFQTRYKYNDQILYGPKKKV